MKETKQFKAFRNTLNESEYKETLTGYPNRSLDTDVGAIKFNAQFIANANAMLNALSKYSYLSTTDALVKIRARLNVLLLDFPWTPRVWSGYAQVPPAAPGENSSVVGLFTLPLTRFGRVDGYDALTGGIRFDGRAGSQDGFQEFTLTVKVELGDDSMYRVIAFVSPKEEPVMAEEGVEVDGDTIDEMAQTPARVKEMQGKLDTAASKIRNKVGDQPAAKKKYNSILSKDRNEFFAKKMYGKGGKEVKEGAEQIDEQSAARRLGQTVGALRRGKPTPKDRLDDLTVERKRRDYQKKLKNDPVFQAQNAAAKKEEQDYIKGEIGRLKTFQKEELVGGQKKLDANKNKRLDSQDFKLLRSKKSVKEDKHDADGSSLEEGILNKAKAYAGGFKQAIGNTIDIFDVGDIIDRTKRYGKDRETRLNKKDAAAKKMQSKSVKEELVGGQKKLDANKNKKLDSQDFKLLRSKKSVKEDVTTEFTTGLPIMDPALGSNIADQSGKGTKRIKKTVDEAAKTPKKTMKKRTTPSGGSEQSAKSHALKDRLKKYGMRW